MMNLLKKPLISIELNQASDQKQKLEKYKKALDEGLKLVKKLIGILSTENIEKQMITVLNIEKLNTYRSLPIQFHGEEAEVKMSIVPKDSASTLQSYYLSPIRFPKSKLYLSAGPMLYVGSLSSNRVATRKEQNIQSIPTSDSTSRMDTTEVFNATRDADLNREIGVAGVIRLGYNYKLFGGHLLVGTGLSLGEETNARLLYGVGVSFGDKHCISLDFGGILGNVKRISNAVDLSDDFLEAPDLLINKVDHSWFIGFGYAFKL